MKKNTNFDLYLAEQLKSPDFAEKFRKMKVILFLYKSVSYKMLSLVVKNLILIMVASE